MLSISKRKSKIGLCGQHPRENYRWRRRHLHQTRELIWRLSNSATRSRTVVNEEPLRNKRTSGGRLNKYKLGIQFVKYSRYSWRQKLLSSSTRRSLKQGRNEGGGEDTPSTGFCFPSGEICLTGVRNLISECGEKKDKIWPIWGWEKKIFFWRFHHFLLFFDQCRLFFAVFRHTLLYSRFLYHFEWVSTIFEQFFSL